MVKIVDENHQRRASHAQHVHVQKFFDFSNSRQYFPLYQIYPQNCIMNFHSIFFFVLVIFETKKKRKLLINLGFYVKYMQHAQQTQRTMN